MSSVLLQTLRLGNLQHGPNHIHQLPSQKPRLRPGQLDQQLQRLLRRDLLTAIQCLSQSLHHQRQQVLEAVPIRRAGQALNKIDSGAEGSDPDIGITPRGGEAIEENVVESGEVRDEGFADIMSQLSENDERKFLQIEIIGSDAVEDKREEFRPGVVG